MTDAGFLELTPQLAAARWGWTIAFFLWFIGLSGMLMALFYFVRDRRFVLIAFAASVLGCPFVLSHLGRLTNLPFAVFHALADLSLNFGSWMLIGICLLALQALLTFFACLVLNGRFKKELAPALVKGRAAPLALAAVGVAVTVYSSFLLTQASGIAFWHTGSFPCSGCSRGWPARLRCGNSWEAATRPPFSAPPGPPGSSSRPRSSSPFSPCCTSPSSTRAKGPTPVRKTRSAESDR
ncbi:hypothetical protein MAF45_00110 [Mesosutterella sp. OilRF-GAM-744-9]|uniref:Uncharacterized protein n=1 Tax=Mesosutterella porci TaxID=2915351 RepID=A0ABS9MML7_9BURK|nr:hypothetical protein [Mesosutterella sp. oilRF-744-WT-GAM-9]MCG5029861.1 hypothetical protein [Mesosutterella sp. oilRF-744-WT-GAM-9]